MKHFTTEYSEIKELIEIINPINYAKTRNFIDGDISKISPFISRGVISTKYILDSIIKKGYTYEESEKFIQELAWRDYYQQIWIDKKEEINDDLPLLIYNFYNIDPLWNQEMNANRILLLEPTFFEKYPSSSKVIDFIIALSHNIPNIQLMVASFEELQNLYKGKKIVFKEHPTNSHYIGTQQNREFLVDTITGYHPSFFSYWKKIKKVIKKQF